MSSIHSTNHPLPFEAVIQPNAVLEKETTLPSDPKDMVGATAATPVPGREYRLQGRKVLKAIKAFDDACQQRQVDRDAFTSNEIRTRLSQALEELRLLKTYQMANHEAADNEEDREDWLVNSETTDDRVKELMSRYEKHVQETIDFPPGSSQHPSQSHHPSTGTGKTRSSARSQASSVSSSVRARREVERQRIALEHKKQEMALKLSVAKKQAEIEALRLQLEVNNTTARFERAQIDMQILDGEEENILTGITQYGADNSHGPANNAANLDGGIAVNQQHITNGTSKNQINGSNQNRSGDIVHRVIQEQRSSTDNLVPADSEVIEQSNHNGVDGVLNAAAQAYCPYPSNRILYQPVSQTLADRPGFENQYHSTSLKNDLQQKDYSSTYAVDKLLHKQLMEGKSEESKFGGSPLDYLSFKNEFNLLLGKFKDDPAYLFSALENSLTGSALSDIRHCKDLLENPSNALQTALEVLKRNYGSDFAVRSAHLKYICDVSKPVKGDLNSIQRLLSDLERCKVLLRMDEHKLQLNAPETIRNVVRRLPDYIQANFVKATNKLANPSCPGFEFLLKFIAKECEYASNPFSDLLYNKSNGYKSKENNTRRTRTSRVNSASIGKSDTDSNNMQEPSASHNMGISTNQSTEKEDKPPCLLCNQPFHRIQDCPLFISKSIEERWKLIKSNKRICYSCLHVGHKSVQCKSKFSCRSCQSKRHHTLLCKGVQGYTSASSGQDTESKQTLKEPATSRSFSASNKTYSNNTYTRVLPLEVFTDEGESCRIYALIDSGADLTIATQSLANKLKLQSDLITIPLEGVHGTQEVHAMEISFRVKSINPPSNESHLLESVTCLVNLPSHAASIPTDAAALRHNHLKDLTFPDLSTDHIDLIVGTDNERLHHILESRLSDNSSLCAYRTPLGWVLAGTDDYKKMEANNRNHIQPTCGDNKQRIYTVCDPSKCWGKCDCQLLLNTIKEIMELPYGTPNDEENDISVEDEVVLKLFKEKLRKVDGHFELPLPLRKPELNLPDNYKLAESRLLSLSKKLRKEPELHLFFKGKFEEYLNKGYIVNVKEENQSPSYGKTSYLPYFCTAQVKPRIVYDGAALYHGTCINRALMSGPDLMQPLLHVLTRFRQDSVAFVCDIKEMFFQVKLPPSDQDMLRILWYANGDLDSEIVKYKFTVHPFGLNSSPAVASYCLRQCALENKSAVSKDTAESVLKQFYVDDGLYSEKSSEDAFLRWNELKALTSDAGFTLAKVISNSMELLSKLDKSELSPNLHNVDINDTGIPQHKTLGVQWIPENDKLVVKVNITNKPPTKRGMLSMLSQVFDPLSICQPYLIEARVILQEVFSGTNSGVEGWDEPLPIEQITRWNKWLKNLDKLGGLKIPRCFHGSGRRPENYQIHTFCDASTIAIACVTFIRYFKDDQWQCSFVRGKSHIISKNNKNSVARLELEAAVLGVTQHTDVLKSLTLPIDVEHSYIWSDSTTVLTWIRNTSRRTKVFVANRRRTIHNLSAISQWKYVSTNSNPADMGTRIISPNKASPENTWLQGPKFLKKDESQWNMAVPCSLRDDNLEWVTPSVVNTLNSGMQVSVATENASARTVLSGDSPLYSLLWKFSNLYKLKRRIAWLRRFKQWILKPHDRENLIGAELTSEELEMALEDIVRLAQEESYTKDVLDNVATHNLDYAISHCNNKEIVAQLKSLANLAPFIKSDGVLRVGGRLQNSNLTEQTKHQFILPRRHHVTKLIIEEAHINNAHFGGTQQVLATLQQAYWVMPAVVKHYLSHCLKCEQLKLRPGHQMMAPLPKHRSNFGGPPFQGTGVDYFGPFLIRVNRGLQKRWVALYTCLATRGVHLEIVHSLSTSSFLQSLSRFNNSRGNPLRLLVSDNATTFHGADNELKEAILNLDSDETRRHLQKQNITWKFNAPLASHQGGVFERMIRSVRKILSGLSAFERSSPREENFMTVIKEAEAIINNRPLTHIRGDPDEFMALTPGMILYGHLGNNTPFDVFHNDEQLRCDWRYTQIATEQFWCRFVKEYLSALQKRSKWLKPEVNISVGDLVLIRDGTMVRQQYPKALVTEVYPGSDGIVRNVQVRTPDGRKFTRDIRKLIPLELANKHLEERN